MDWTPEDNEFHVWASISEQWIDGLEHVTLLNRPNINATWILSASAGNFSFENLSFIPFYIFKALKNQWENQPLEIEFFCWVGLTKGVWRESGAF